MLSPLGAGLLLIGSLALSIAEAGNEPTVDFDDGLVTLRAEDVATVDLLEAIAAAAGLRLVQHARPEGTVTAYFDSEPLAAVLDALAAHIARHARAPS